MTSDGDDAAQDPFEELGREAELWVLRREIARDKTRCYLTYAVAVFLIAMLLLVIVKEARPLHVLRALGIVGSPHAHPW